MADLVQPYIVWDGLSAFADGADATSTDDSSLASWNEVRAEWSNSFAWDVGGALHVDATALFVLPASEAAIAAGRCPLALDPATLARLRTDTNGGLTGEVIGSPTSTVHMGIGGGGGSEVNPNPNLGSETIWSNIFSTIPSNPSPLHKGWTPYGSRYTAAHAFGSAHAPDGSQTTADNRSRPYLNNEPTHPLYLLKNPSLRIKELTRPHARKLLPMSDRL